MTREEAIQELQNCKGLIQQDGQDYLDERDIPLLDIAIEALSVANLKEEFESANATPTVIRAKTFMRKEDFDKWAEDIKKQNKSIVCIPCDAEVVSDDAVVRCKDCIQKHIGGNVTHYYWCDLWDREVNETDYCAWGERREPGK